MAENTEDLLKLMRQQADDVWRLDGHQDCARTLHDYANRLEIAFQAQVEALTAKLAEERRERKLLGECFDASEARCQELRTSADALTTERDEARGHERAEARMRKEDAFAHINEQVEHQKQLHALKARAETAKQQLEAAREALINLRAMIIGEHGTSAYENVNGERADAIIAGLPPFLPPSQSHGAAAILRAALAKLPRLNCEETLSMHEYVDADELQRALDEAKEQK